MSKATKDLIDTITENLKMDMENLTFREEETPSTSKNAEMQQNSPIQNLRFDDIKSAFRMFKGGQSTDVIQWISHFEEQSTVFALNETQKFIFAKRVMEGAAKLFIDFESKATTWLKLKKELKDEFGAEMNSALVHQQLSQRKKKNNETTLDYLYEMLSIGAKGNVDQTAIFTYTIDGLPGSPAVKSFMYEAKSIRDFKHKLESYELIMPKITSQNNSKIAKMNEIQEKNKEKAKALEQNRCKNCGSKLHKT